MCKQYFDVIEYTQKFVDKGIEINSYPKEDLERIQKLIDRHTEEIAAKEPLFKKSIQSQMEFRKKFAKWRQMEGPFGFGYNPTSYPDLEKNPKE